MMGRINGWSFPTYLYKYKTPGTPKKNDDIAIHFVSSGLRVNLEYRSDILFSFSDSIRKPSPNSSNMYSIWFVCENRVCSIFIYVVDICIRDFLTRTHFAYFVFVFLYSFFWFNRKLLRLMFPATSQIVHSRFQPFIPRIKMHRSESIVVGVFHP